MRRIVISIRPQWVVKILNGEKTIEIRKTAPKCELPCFDPTKEACVSQDGLRGYLKGKDGYAWHIDKLVPFDKPKELKDYGVKRSPQSWQFIEVDE